MLNKEKVLAIIPARGGSKRLPRKNVLTLAGKPCISWTIEAALESEYIDDIVVSTDDPETKSIARGHRGIEVVDRPRSLALDSTRTVDVVFHVLETYKFKTIDYQWFILLQPTSPLRTSSDIDAAFDLIRTRNAMGAVGICATPHPREWIASTTPGQSLDEFFRSTALNESSTVLPKSYTVNGAIYILRITLFSKEKTFFPFAHILGYEMGRHRSVDIDNKFDFDFASYLLNNSLDT